MNALTLFAYSYPLFLVSVFGFVAVLLRCWKCSKYYEKIATADVLSRLSRLAQGSVTGCHRVGVSSIPPQDHARNRLLHALYAPRKRLASTLGPRAATGMRDAGYELPRISVLRRSLNSAWPRARAAVTLGQAMVVSQGIMRPTSRGKPGMSLGNRAGGEQQGRGYAVSRTLALSAERRFRPKLLRWSLPMMGRS
jgi:hypothetical protein